MGGLAQVPPAHAGCCPPLRGQRAVLSCHLPWPSGCTPTAAVLLTILGQEAAATINNRRACPGHRVAYKASPTSIRRLLQPPRPLAPRCTERKRKVSTETIPLSLCPAPLGGPKSETQNHGERHTPRKGRVNTASPRGTSPPGWKRGQGRGRGGAGGWAFSWTLLVLRGQSRGPLPGQLTPECLGPAVTAEVLSPLREPRASPPHPTPNSPVSSTSPPACLC